MYILKKNKLLLLLLLNQYLWSQVFHSNDFLLIWAQENMIEIFQFIKHLLREILLLNVIKF